MSRTEEAVEAQAEISPADVEAARAEWLEHAPEEARALIDAREDAD